MTEYADRRREPRLPFRSDCTIEVLAPPEDAVSGLLQGQTVNITEHGLMVAIPGIREDVVRRWQTAVDEDRVILVQVLLTSFPAAPPLKGQIVWTHWCKSEEFGGAVCRLGLLFQILDDSEIETLREILTGIATQQDY